MATKQILVNYDVTIDTKIILGKQNISAITDTCEIHISAMTD
jgi:hypothetical protein